VRRPPLSAISSRKMPIADIFLRPSSVQPIARILRPPGFSLVPVLDTQPASINFSSKDWRGDRALLMKVKVGYARSSSLRRTKIGAECICFQ
jgi:hypothetical protein